jgi:predicted small secreted protein
MLERFLDSSMIKKIKMKTNNSLPKILGLLCTFAFTSCSTVEGIGKDVQGLGRAIEKTSSSATGKKSTTPVTPSESNQPATSGAVVTPVR